MRAKRFPNFVSTAGHRAFTIVELLVAISVLTLIVLVLFGLFDQVQKALRGNIAQVDVSEGARAAMQLIAGEMEQMEAGNVPASTNLYVGLAALPYRQALLDPGTNRVNVLDELFFLSHENKNWSGTGYRILRAPANAVAAGLANTGIGTLCRYSVRAHEADFPNASGLPRSNLVVQVMQPTLNGSNNLANYQPVLDGVVHFRIRAFDTNGMVMASNIYPNVKIFTNVVFSGQVTGETQYTFTRSALPSYLELELGILEPHVLERLKSFPDPTVASNFLARQVGAVHLFQIRIPIRAAK